MAGLIGKAIKRQGERLRLEDEARESVERGLKAFDNAEEVTKTETGAEVGVLGGAVGFGLAAGGLPLPLLGALAVPGGIIAIPAAMIVGSLFGGFCGATIGGIMDATESE